MLASNADLAAKLEKLEQKYDSQFRLSFDAIQLNEAAKILGFHVLDHVIVTRKGFFSFQEAGLLGS
jgi:hypothetical protein